MAVRQPAGVVLGIAPWNAPVILGVRAIATCSPAATPRCSGPRAVPGHPRPDHRGAAGRRAAGGRGELRHQRPGRRPRGGRGHGRAPGAAPGNFTGSTHVGRLIAQTCAKYLAGGARAGGKAPFVVLDDADLDAAVAAATFGAFANSGQICMSTERIIVDAAVADDFVARLAARARACPGRPAQGPGGARLGGRPAHGRALQRADRRCARQGATLVCGGKADSTLMPATLLDHVSAQMRIYHEETFAPVKAIVRVQAPRPPSPAPTTTLRPRRRGVRARPARAWQVAGRIQSGICHINGPTVHDEAQMPFGGVKDSGWGRFGGQAGIEALHRAALDHPRRARATTRSEAPAAPGPQPEAAACIIASHRIARRKHREETS